MKLILEPSAGDDAHYFPAISIDTNTNDEDTRDFAELVISLGYAAGHHPQVLHEAMIRAARERIATDKMRMKKEEDKANE